MIACVCISSTVSTMTQSPHLRVIDIVDDDHSDHEWIAVREWALATTALRRRARLFESMLPFATGFDSDTKNIVQTVQRWIRGHLARHRAHVRRALRGAFGEWTTYAKRTKDVIRMQTNMLRIHSVSLIQVAFRRFVCYWNRPRVCALLRRIQMLESRLNEEVKEEGRTKVKKNRKRSRTLMHIPLTVSRACQTTGVPGVHLSRPTASLSDGLLQ